MTINSTLSKKLVHGSYNPMNEYEKMWTNTSSKNTY